MGVSGERARQLCYLAKGVRKKNRDIMLAAGIPEELLPAEAKR